MNLEEEIKYLRAKNAELLQSQKALEEKVLVTSQHYFVTAKFIWQVVLD